MITKDNFKQVLNHLNFTQSLVDTIYTKYFKEFDCELKVDFEAKKLIFPKELIVNDETTSNFSSPEIIDNTKVKKENILGKYL